MDRNYFENVHRKETVKTLSIRGTNTTMVFCLFALKEARWSCINFPSIEIISKNNIKMTLIIHPSKLHQKITSIWHGNSSVLMCQRNFNIDLTYWVCWYNIGTLSLVLTQNHRCFNVKCRRWFNVDKLTLFRRWNTVIFSTLI